MPQLFALFRNDLRLPADKLALKLEQILRFPRMNNFMRKVEGVGERLLGQEQRPLAEFRCLLVDIFGRFASCCKKPFQRALTGTSKNRRYFSNGAKLPSNDSVSFSFRFMDVHP